jgi:hypothetical protein
MSHDAIGGNLVLKLSKRQCQDLTFSLMELEYVEINRTPE